MRDEREVTKLQQGASSFAGPLGGWCGVREDCLVWRRAGNSWKKHTEDYDDEYQFNMSHSSRMVYGANRGIVEHKEALSS